MTRPHCLEPLLALAVLGGCYASTPTTPSPAIARAPEPRPIAVADLCPLRVPGAVVAVDDVEHGGALAFTTAGDVADLRRRVRAMADVHDLNRDALVATLRREAELHAATRYVEDLPGGARIVFRPPHETDLDGYRDALVSEANRMRAGQCPMIMPPAADESPQIATAHR